MSGTLKERSRKVSAGKRGGAGGGNDEEGGDGLTNKDDSDEHIKKANGRKVKRVSFFCFRKFNNRKKQLGCFGYPKCCGGGGRRGGGGGGCYLCMKKPVTLESSGESSPTSDPNSSEFSYDMLRSLIENNHFYDKDCDTHLVTEFDEYRQVSAAPCCDHMKAK
ncbi:hypothetical protein Leryth_007260 [Lithospermum erythrorhizon]|nr:hypothetical protein Leryth_007260 [Lithospermum erythrorhizon]